MIPATRPFRIGIVYGPAALQRADDGDDAKKIMCDILAVDAQKNSCLFIGSYN